MQRQNAGALGPLDDAVLVCTVHMDAVTIDAHARTARVQAGTLWGVP
jgi:FAD/FMN-containing dehydrogenase